MRILTIILLLLICGRVCFATDKLDAVKDNSQLINDMKDVYHAYHIHGVITDELQMIRLLDQDDPAGLKEYVTSALAANKKLSTANISNKKAKAYIDSYLVNTNTNFKILLTKGAASKEYSANLKKYKEIRHRCMNFIAITFSVEKFVTFTEKDYWKNIDKNNFIKNARYKDFDTRKKTDVTGSRRLLRNIIAETGDFQEKAIYKIALADQYVKYDSVSAYAHDSAIAIYKGIMDEQKYCLYLYESWLKWRMLTQWNYGLSKSSDIPNDLYDRKREDMALVILKHISMNPKDEMAINEFLVVASHEIVMRFGDYPYGNQNTIEYHETFDDPQ